MDRKQMKAAIKAAYESGDETRMRQLSREEPRLFRKISRFMLTKEHRRQQRAGLIPGDLEFNEWLDQKRRT